jgi:hypothetical protein
MAPGVAQKSGSVTVSSARSQSWPTATTSDDTPGCGCVWRGGGGGDGGVGGGGGWRWTYRGVKPGLGVEERLGATCGKSVGEHQRTLEPGSLQPGMGEQVMWVW